MITHGKSFNEQLADAIDSGNTQQVDAYYRYQERLMGGNPDGQYISINILKSLNNAAKRDPEKLQRDLILQILCFQGMLLHRVEAAIKRSIRDYDYKDHPEPWGWLPIAVTDELLPRYGKLSAEVMATIRLLHKHGSPATAAPPPPASA